MSLQLAAKHLASHGRGGDTTLVHMNPREVQSLQQLAMAHGGSLSVNPNTGLPEASFLSSILPMVGGAAMTMLSGGAINPMTAGLIMGGVTGLSSGDLQKGLMAGLGAYGGAGLMGGLIGAGAAPAVESAATAAGPVGSSEAGFAGNQALASAQASPFTTAGQGISGLTTEAGRNAFMQNIGGGSGLLKYGAAAAAPVLTEAMKPKEETPAKVDSDAGPKQYYSPGRVGPTPAPDVNNYQNMGRDTGREQTYFRPQFSTSPFPQTVTRTPFAAGGPVEEMSNQNAVGANTGFPMADINHAAYATPYQQPISQNVVTGPQDTRVDPYTGEMKFADGGLLENLLGQVKTAQSDANPTKLVYDPKTQTYREAVAAAPATAESKSEWNYPVQNSGPDSISTGQPSALGQNISLGLISPMSGLQMALQDVPMSPVANFAGALLGNVNTANNGFSIASVGPPSQAQAHGFSPAADSQAANVALGLSNPNAPAAPAVAPAQAPVSALADVVGGATNSNANQGFNPGIASLGMGALAALGGMPGMVGSQAPAPVSDIGTMAAFGQQQGSLANEMESQNEANNAGSSGSNGGMGGIDGSGASMSAADADAAFARGGLSHLGDYSDGGRLLRGPGDGVSDSIPAMIGKRQPARLADGEFVVPARIVSELGNGSTEAGARKLYAMMDRVQAARSKTVGKGKVAKNSRADRFLPA